MHFAFKHSLQNPTKSPLIQCLVSSDELQKPFCDLSEKVIPLLMETQLSLKRKKKKKNLPPSFNRTLPHLDLGRSQPTFFLLHPSDWCWGMARGFRKPLCGLAQAKPRLVCEKSRGQSNTCLWSARLHGLQERPL